MIWRKFIVVKNNEHEDILKRIIPIFCHYVFEHFNIQKIYACVYEQDTSSMKYFKETGFKEEGVLKQAILKEEKLVDEHRFYILKSEFINAK